ncbi:MAG: calcium/sodium antiporter [Bdellovibrionia bacterium]
MNLELFGLIVFGLVFLVVGGEFLVRGASQLAAIIGIPPVVVGLTIVAFGTSAPELAVSLKAALGGNADIAVANVVGSNNFNVLFILGISALVSPLIIHSQMITREVPILIGASLLLGGMAYMGKNISPAEGALLAILIVAYTAWLVYEALKNKKANQELIRESEQEFSAPKKGKGKAALISLVYVVGGLAVIMFGADWLVKGAITLAKLLGVSDTVIGLTIVAAGTSLPEVVASVMATIKGERDIAVGNVVGSNIYNIFAILGISGFIAPEGLNVSDSLLYFDIPVMILVSLIMWPIFKTGQRISRKEGAFFLISYVLYTLYLIVNAQA